MLTRLEFRNRFTLTEKVAIELAAADNPSNTMQQRQLAATLRVFLDDLAAASYVDETRADTRAGVRALAQYGLIAAGRADEILAASGVPTTTAPEFTLAADQPSADGAYCVAIGGTYEANALVAVYRAGDETKTAICAFSARYVATGVNE